jgi:DnaJ-class molecular chaperone
MVNLKGQEINPFSFLGRKIKRVEAFEARYKKKMITCGACNGSGYYDHNGSPECGNCEGKGKVRE